MDPFNANTQTPVTKPLSNTANPQGDPVHGHKKRVLQTLMHAALGVAGNGRNIHDTVHGVKTALGAYKNYAKNWDELHGIVPSKDGSGGPGMPGQPAPQAAAGQAQAAANRPATPNLQVPNPRPPIAQQMVQPPKMPQQPQSLIAPAMPAFMGGGRPAGQ